MKCLIGNVAGRASRPATFLLSVSAGRSVNGPSAVYLLQNVIPMNDPPWIDHETALNFDGVLCILTGSREAHRLYPRRLRLERVGLGSGQVLQHLAALLSRHPIISAPSAGQFLSRGGHGSLPWLSDCRIRPSGRWICSSVP